ncbi:regulatory protein TetR [Pseudonocardia dioxanivorans CB1190]|uniref:Regulatory protein TetR n=2 Tax=Pseudonocardia TaxID=1847 RepID=F4CKU1_PSEUX|nr:regulatory protein TetR [Pseudonocardia dioxanivorans CB1190]
MVAGGPIQPYGDRMTGSANPVTESDGRLERVLDAAADLLVRWGYQRVTVEDVARHARIGKGTVYLHFRSKDALFLTVLLRSHHHVVSRMADRMAADPAEVLPSRMTAAVYLDLVADPVVRPLYLGDPEVLGRLAHEAADSLGALSATRDAAARRLFGLLREAGALRTDLSLDEQQYLLQAVASGFLFVDSLPASDAPADHGRRAALIAHTIAAAIEEPGAEARAAGVAPQAVAMFRGLAAEMDQEWRRRVR